MHFTSRGFVFIGCRIRSRRWRAITEVIMKMGELGGCRWWLWVAKDVLFARELCLYSKLQTIGNDQAALRTENLIASFGCRFGWEKQLFSSFSDDGDDGDELAIVYSTRGWKRSTSLVFPRSHPFLPGNIIFPCSCLIKADQQQDKSISLMSPLRLAFWGKEGGN